MPTSTDLSQTHRAVEAQRRALALDRDALQQRHRETLTNAVIGGARDGTAARAAGSDLAEHDRQLADLDVVLDGLNERIAAARAAEDRQHQADRAAHHQAAQQRLDARLAAVEQALGPLADAVVVALAAGRAVEVAAGNAGTLSPYSARPLALATWSIANRITAVLADAGIAWQVWQGARPDATPLGPKE